MLVSIENILVPEEYRTLIDEEKVKPIIRSIIDPNGEPYFVARDVATILGYENTKKAVIDHCFNPIFVIDLINTLQIQGSRIVTPIGINDLHPQTKLIREPDLYALIIRSKLESAKKFQLWVFEEVLPSIRKTGQYSVNQGVNLPYNIVNNLFNQLKILNQNVTDMRAELVPKALVYDLIVKQNDTFSMEEAAKLLNTKYLNGNSNKLSNRVLLDFLRNNKYISEKNIAYQRYVNCGYFEYKFTKRNRDSIYDHDVIISSTQFTSKGLIWIVGPLKKAGLIPISHDYDKYVPVVPTISQEKYTPINYDSNLDSNYIGIQNIDLNPNSQTYRLISNNI